MKKIFAFALVAMMTLAANAQVFVGGSLGYQSSKPTKGAESVNTFKFAPEVGYNLDENWTIGLALDYTSTDNSVTTNSSFGVSIYGRYNYFKTGIATLFVEANTGIEAYNHDGGNVFHIGVLPGVSFAVTDKLSLVAKTGVLGYKKYSSEAGGGSSFGVGVDNTDLSLGLFYNF
jgi:hypothetical protein